MSRRPILGLWASRTDAARRTKGDPPPTYAQLETTVAALTATLKTQGEIIRNLRSQVDGLIAENRELRTALAERTDDVGTLAAELAEAKPLREILGIDEVWPTSAEPKPTLREERIPLPVERDERHLGPGGER